MSVTEGYIREIIGEKLLELDAFLVEVSIKAGRISVLIDRDQGINVRECAKLSRFLEGILEEQGALETHELEVSSPGLERSLKVKRQYVKSLGRTLKVTTLSGAEKTGVLLDVTDADIELEENITTKENKKKKTIKVKTRIPFNEIKETKIVISFK
jgi:ribosome maturation factor RimP